MAGYFIQNLIFHDFIKKKRGCVTDRGGGNICFQANGINSGYFYK
jgi:hypothetical protein